MLSRTFFWTLLPLLALSFTLTAPLSSANDNPVVVIETSMGHIEVELYADQAPKTVTNFLSYVDAGHYDGTIFHRVIENFMIQGGGFDVDLVQKPTQAPIQNEADNGLRNKVGTIAMARTNDPHSATAQFFINTQANDFLDFREKTPRGWGYAVFGRVSDGLKTVNQIRKVATTRQGMHADVPVTPVIIKRIVRQTP